MSCMTHSCAARGCHWMHFDNTRHGPVGGCPEHGREYLQHDFDEPEDDEQYARDFAELRDDNE